MLVLSRKIGESVVIGKSIYCTVLGCKGNQVRLGFEAPDFVTIHREEVFEKNKVTEIKKTNQQ